MFQFEDDFIFEARMHRLIFEDVYVDSLDFNCEVMPFKFLYERARTLR